MTRRLILMRHAKSSWAAPGLSDHARPLSARGRREAPIVAQEISAAHWEPELALVSDAARTEETWAWMTERFEREIPFVLVPSLYHGTLDDIRRAIAERVTGERTVLVLGHNPGWEDALARLCGRSLPMKTAWAALLEHPASWPEAMAAGDWRLAGLVTPSL